MPPATMQCSARRPCLEPLQPYALPPASRLELGTLGAEARGWEGEVGCQLPRKRGRRGNHRRSPLRSVWGSELPPLSTLTATGDLLDLLGPQELQRSRIDEWMGRTCRAIGSLVFQPGQSGGPLGSFFRVGSMNRRFEPLHPHLYWYTWAQPHLSLHGLDHIWSNTPVHQRTPNWRFLATNTDYLGCTGSWIVVNLFEIYCSGQEAVQVVAWQAEFVRVRI
jgi:hypothetical protein